MKINTIENADCVKAMKKCLDDESIDMIIADPPYVISRPSQLGTMPDRKSQELALSSAIGIRILIIKMVKSSGKSFEKGGSLIVFNDVKKISIIIKQAEAAGLVYKDTIIWHKTNPMPRNIKRRYVSDIEVAIWFVKPGKKWTFNCINSPYMSCIKKCSVESGGGFKRIHPTQKPLKLITSFILTHTEENDIVLDPFMGSGTTALACLENRRRYVGFEIDKEYYESSLIRIKEYGNDKKYNCPFHYIGGKSKLLPQILPLIDSFDPELVVDLFSGGFSVGLNCKCRTVICNDKNNRFIDLLNWLYSEKRKIY